MAKEKIVNTVVGTITGAGTALFTVTASGMLNSPKAVAVSCDTSDSVGDIAQSARYALAIDIDISKFFLVSGTAAAIDLEARVDAPDDTTMNLAIANGTCSGLTASPTSTVSVHGASVLSHAYISLDDMHSYMRSHEGTFSINTLDDGMISQLIESASRYIDHNAARKFYLSSETRYFDTPGWEQYIQYGGMYSGHLPSLQFYENKLRVDDDLYSVTEIINGNGDTLDPTTDYALLPYTDTPHYAIILRNNKLWTPNTSNDPIMAIQVTGQWGFCDIADVPADIVEATFLITKAALNRRFGENITQRAVVTQAGAIIGPEDVPDKARDIILCHLRVAFG